MTAIWCHCVGVCVTLSIALVSQLHSGMQRFPFPKCLSHTERMPLVLCVYCMICGFVRSWRQRGLYSTAEAVFIGDRSASWLNIWVFVVYNLIALPLIHPALCPSSGGCRTKIEQWHWLSVRWNKVNLALVDFKKIIGSYDPRLLPPKEIRRATNLWLRWLHCGTLGRLRHTGRLPAAGDVTTTSGRPGGEDDGDDVSKGPLRLHFPPGAILSVEEHQVMMDGR